MHSYRSKAKETKPQNFQKNSDKNTQGTFEFKVIVSGYLCPRMFKLRLDFSYFLCRIVRPNMMENEIG